MRARARERERARARVCQRLIYKINSQCACVHVCVTASVLCAFVCLCRPLAKQLNIVTIRQYHFHLSVSSRH